MKRDDIERRRQEIVDAFGEWTNHNICLQEDLYTIDSHRLVGSEVKVQRILQIVADWMPNSWENLRVLDLACLEGLYGLEMALQGADVVGIEARSANLEKARFAKKVLGTKNISFCQDDVRYFSAEKYGYFDVILCLGILYHLDVPDVFSFLENIAHACRGLVILDTHVALNAEISYQYQQQTYWGRIYSEHSPKSSLKERKNVLWSSLDNVQSFWLTRASLLNFCDRVGFTSVYECHQPLVPKYEVMRQQKQADRATFVAIKGTPTRVKTSSHLYNFPKPQWQEMWET
ncbi:methyltransferase domain-containing protein [Geitlerinema sp. PCC 9228]|uniref:class I SAM-dependent methyltransferase n=1 Tax=Geitlerinema sp. PCC 9228 TaxID=111611 RepID=UPI0008F99157|nr:methyltransferase domain-containing protein [Geitlerinema sp. PCC 9228]